MIAVFAFNNARVADLAGLVVCPLFKRFYKLSAGNIAVQTAFAALTAGGEGSGILAVLFRQSRKALFGSIAPFVFFQVVLTKGIGFLSGQNAVAVRIG